MSEDVSVNEDEDGLLDEAPIPQPISTAIELVCTKCDIPHYHTIERSRAATIKCSNCGRFLSHVFPVVGYVYLLTNPSMPGLVKVGFTNRFVEERLRELTAATGVPTEFVIGAVFHSANPQFDEQQLHERLASYRVTPNKESFRIPLEEAIAIAKRVLSRQPCLLREGSPNYQVL